MPVLPPSAAPWPVTGSSHLSSQLLGVLWELQLQLVPDLYLLEGLLDRDRSSPKIK